MKTKQSAPKALQIFKPGQQTASNGETITFSEGDMLASVKAYDPKLHEAPLVVGHPKHDLPAYGWVKALGFEEGHLLAEPDQVDAEFAELVNAGRYKKISASFYKPDAPGNPVPGVWYLRHVGFLGAQPPAVKGLKSASFSEDEEGVIALEFGEMETRTSANLWRRFRDWLIGEKGLDEADKVIPDYLVKNLEQEAARPDADAAPGPTYNEPPKEDVQVTLTPEQLAAREADLKRREAALKADEAKVAGAKDAQFLEGLTKEGKLLPAHREFLASFMAQLPADTILEFGEGEKKTSQPIKDAFKKFLGELPKAVEFKELAPDETPADSAVSFAAPAGSTVSPERAELHRKTLDYQAAHPGTDFVTAYKAVGGN